MSNLNTNHYLISMILFLLIVIVYMSTKQSLCSIKENFANNSSIKSQNLSIEDGYDSVMNVQDDFVANSVVNEDSSVVSDAINEFNIGAKEDIEVKATTEGKHSDSQYLSDSDYSQSDGNVYSLTKSEHVNHNLNTDAKLMGTRQSNEDVYGNVGTLEPVADDNVPSDGVIIEDEGIKEDPDLGKPNTCEDKTLPEFGPGPYDPFNKYSFSEFDINFAKTKAYRPENVGVELEQKLEIEDNMSHEQNIYDKEKCKVIKNALKKIDKKHFTKTAKEPWDSKFKKPCGSW